MTYTVLYSNYSSTLLCSPIAKRKEFKHKEIAKWFAKRMKMCYDWVECVESKYLEVTYWIF